MYMCICVEYLMHMYICTGFCVITDVVMEGTEFSIWPQQCTIKVNTSLCTPDGLMATSVSVYTYTNVIHLQGIYI